MSEDSYMYGERVVKLPAEPLVTPNSESENLPPSKEMSSAKEMSERSTAWYLRHSLKILEGESFVFSGGGMALVTTSFLEQHSVHWYGVFLTGLGVALGILHDKLESKKKNSTSGADDLYEELKRNNPNLGN